MPNKGRLLIVDDSISVVNSLQTILSLSGYSVDSAFNGSDALRKIYRQDYDLVICDIEMPGLTGLEFLERVRKEFDRSLDVILMTGYMEHDYFIEAIRLGANDFIRKPIDTKKMIKSIQELLHRKRSIKDNEVLYSKLDKVGISMEVNAINFGSISFSSIFNKHLKERFKINPDALNELMVCLDEMIYNAFIHGTLELNPEDRALDHEKLQEVIAQKLQQPDIGRRKISILAEIDNGTKSIKLTVEDEGPGFDYEAWQKISFPEPILGVQEHGRGISLLKHLSEELCFAKEGRQVSIRKSLIYPGKNAP